MTGPQRNRASTGAPVDGGGTASGRASRLQSGEVLCRQGEAVEALFRVRQGMVKLVTYLRGGEARLAPAARRGLARAGGIP